jgi:hypothetical protein
MIRRRADVMDIILINRVFHGSDCRPKHDAVLPWQAAFDDVRGCHCLRSTTSDITRGDHIESGALPMTFTLATLHQADTE